MNYFFIIKMNYQLEENKKIDYTKPIFVYYMNISGLSRQQAESEIANIVETMHQEDVQMWFVPCNINDNRIECIYPGMVDKEFNEKMKDTVNNILLMLDGIGGDTGIIDKLKENVRNILLTNLIK